MSTTMYRYEVLGTDGEVPEGIREGAVLLYPEDRGEWSEQALHRDGEGIVGGWTMRACGTVEVDEGGSIVATSTGGAAQLD